MSLRKTLHSLLVLASLLIAAGAAATGDSGAALIDALNRDDKRPNAEQTLSLVKAGAVLLDVRSLDEWSQGHAKGAIFLTWRSVDDQAARLLPDKNTPVVTYCAIGVRAWYAASSLRKLGYTHVTAMTGGYADMLKAGYGIEASGKP